jgi:hypothetical protein
MHDKFSITTKNGARLVDEALDLFIMKKIIRVKGTDLSLKKEEQVDNIILSYDRNSTEPSFARGKWSLEDFFLYADGDMRLLGLLTDLKINFILACANYYETVVSNNHLINEPKHIAPIKNLETRLAIQDSLGSYILRYRALWDKIMGILVYMYNHKRYEDYCGSKSKKKAFKKIFPVHSNVWNQIRPFIDAIEAFDNKYRTPEAHGVSSSIKQTLSNKKPFHTDLIEINQLFNQSISFVNVFADLLNKAKMPKG